MFNDKSTAAERQAVLQALLRRGAQDAAGSPHTPEELNRLLARCGGLPSRVPAFPSCASLSLPCGNHCNLGLQASNEYCCRAPTHSS